MLEPLDRRHLFDVLRPPSGYDVDLAIGTTYSLDLMALLAVPLAFALFDWEDEQGRVNPDPLALLEAARRYAGVTHIFCQSGQIHLPKQQSPLFYELEQVVKQVRAPHPRGIFHPKLWILRFISPVRDEPVLYRVLCLSRNLTFDRSWDTLLRLDGQVANRDRAIAANHPLADFIGALPRMMSQPAQTSLLKSLNKVQEEIRRVRFELPEGVEDIRFHPLGLTPDGDWWFDGRVDKILAMAPFVDEVFLKRMGTLVNGEKLLVSRLDQLRELKVDPIGKCDKVFYLHPDAIEDSTDITDQEPSVSEKSVSIQQIDPVELLSGLHAKLFITDAGWNSSVWTGSANATNAAFSRNVEFLVQLTGKKCNMGVDAFLAQTKGITRFADLLHEFFPDDSPVERDEEARAAEEAAKRVQQALIDLQLKATVSAVEQSSEYSIVLAGTGKSVRLDQASTTTLRCWPVTLQKAQSVDAGPLLLGSALNIPKSSFEALTAFWAFAVESRIGKKTHVLSFVLNLPVTGMPADRPERLLRSILKDKSRVLKLLLLLLTDTGRDLLSGLATSDVVISESEKATGATEQLSLLEPMLQMLEHNPERFRRIAHLISDLEKTPDGATLLPDGFMEIWVPIWEVAQKVLNEQDKP